MQMKGEERIAASQARVWDALNDTEILRASIPGCQSLERDPDGRLRAIVEVKIGPIGARFNGIVTLSDIDAPQGYTITGEGQGGTVGHAKGGAKVRLSADGAGATLLSYEVNAEVGGRLAQLGGPIIDATAKQLAGKFFRTFGAVVAGDGSGTNTAAIAGAGTAGAKVAAPAPVHPVAIGTASYPLAWVLAVVAAILTGFLMGRSAAADWWMVAVAVLIVLVSSAAYQAGLRKGGR